MFVGGGLFYYWAKGIGTSTMGTGVGNSDAIVVIFRIRA